MIREIKNRFVVEINGKSYGKYRTKKAALHKEGQVAFSQRPSEKVKKR